MQTTPLLSLGTLPWCCHPSYHHSSHKLQASRRKHGGPLRFSSQGSPASLLSFLQFDTAQRKSRGTHSSPGARPSAAWLPSTGLPLREGLKLRKKRDKCEASHPDQDTPGPQTSLNPDRSAGGSGLERREGAVHWLRPRTPPSHDTDAHCQEP